MSTLFCPISDYNYLQQLTLYKSFRPLFEAVGYTEMTRIRKLEMYSQCRARQELINKCAESLCSIAEVLSKDEYALLSEQLLCEFEIVEDVLNQLDIYNTIDHPPTGDELFLKKYGKSPSYVLRKYITDRPAKDLKNDYGIIDEPKFKDEATRLLIKAQANSRRNETIQRIHNEMTLRHSQGWYFIFDTLTLSNDCVQQFYETKTALRDYFRVVSRKVLSAEGRPVKESSSDCYSYICVPEFGGETGRLHFHIVHFMRTLPSGTVDPNFGKQKRIYRQVDTLRGLWKYGFTQPIAVRYSGDAFTKRGWLTPVDKDGKSVDSKPMIAVAHYVAKYINKKTEQELISKNVSGEKWNNYLQNEMKLMPKTLFRTRMTRGFGMHVASMKNLSNNALLQMTRLSANVTKMPSVLKRNAKKELRSRLVHLSLTDVLELKPKTMNLLKSFRDLIQKTHQFNPQNFTDLLTPKLNPSDISEEVINYVTSNSYQPTKRATPQFAFGSK